MCRFAGSQIERCAECLDCERKIFPHAEEIRLLGNVHSSARNIPPPIRYNPRAGNDSASSVSGRRNLVAVRDAEPPNATLVLNSVTNYPKQS